MRDTYWVDVPDGQDAALIISMAICIDRIHGLHVIKTTSRTLRLHGGRPQYALAWSGANSLPSPEAKVGSSTVL
jgi:hypothetical protein